MPGRCQTPLPSTGLCDWQNCDTGSNYEDSKTKDNLDQKASGLNEAQVCTFPTSLTVDYPVANLVYSRFADVRTLTLLVGPEKTHFYVHKHLLFGSSQFFKAAFDSKFREAAAREMRLPEDDAASWEHIVRWLYHSNSRSEIRVLPVVPEDADLVQIAETYTLTEKYHLIKLKNQICKEIWELMMRIRLPPQEFATIIYENTPRNDILRQMLPLWFTWCYISSIARLETMRELLGRVPELLMDITLELIKTPLTKREFRKQASLFWDELEEREASRNVEDSEDGDAGNLETSDDPDG